MTNNINTVKNRAAKALMRNENATVCQLMISRFPTIKPLMNANGDLTKSNIIRC